MSIDELREWQSFDSVNPIGDYRQDLNFALLNQTIAAWSGHCKDVPSVKDLLAINPFPVTREQQRIEQAAQDAERSQLYVESLISSLQRRVKK